MLGEELKVTDGAEVGAWIKAGLGGEFGAVSRQLPPVFDAYARVFHRAADSAGNHVTWDEVAERLGRTAHREMQWHQLVGTTDSFGIEGSNWAGSIPSLGELEAEELDRLCAVLADHTPEPERCFFGLCLINSTLARNLAGRGTELKLPAGRDHVVLAGPLSAVDQIHADRYWRESPQLIWPADRSWIVVTEVDFDSTLVGGGRDPIDAIVACPELEAYEVEPDTSLAAFSDKINLVPEPKDE